MKWFQHLSQNSIQDPQLTRLLDDLGVEGYGRYYLLLECLVRSADDTETAPISAFSVKRWAVVLRLKPKKVKTFLDYLHNVFLIKVLHSPNETSVKLLNHTRLLSKRAISSSKRSPGSSTTLHNTSYPDLKIKTEVKDRVAVIGNPAILAAAKTNPEAAKALEAIRNGKVSS